MSTSNNTNEQLSTPRVRTNVESRKNHKRSALIVGAALVLALGGTSAALIATSAASANQTPQTVQTKVVKREASEVVRSRPARTTKQAEQTENKQAQQAELQTEQPYEAQQVVETTETTQAVYKTQSNSSADDKCISQDDAITAALKAVSYGLPNEAYAKLHTDGDSDYYVVTLDYEYDTDIVAVDAGSGTVISITSEPASSENLVEPTDVTTEDAAIN